MTSLTRRTKETKVQIRRATHSDATIRTGKPFFDHMLTALTRYAGLAVSIEADGDLTHHLMEDVALTLGAYLHKVTPADAARYGERTIPMDDALVQAVIDIGGRPYFRGKLPSPLYTHFFRSLATTSLSTLHLRVLRGHNRHHIIEAAFKATGLALGDAMRVTGSGLTFSTKGSVSWEETA